MPAPRTLEDLLDIHAIHELKHRYLRCLDQKAWDELATCFTEDATASYGGGAVELDGRDAILELPHRARWAPPGCSRATAAPSPRSTSSGPADATGTWALEDVVIHQDFGVTIHGASFYEDRYVKVDGTLAHPRHGLQAHLRGDLATRPRSTGLRLSADFWATGGRSDLI